MKRNEFLDLLINPFTRIAGWQALMSGITVFALTIYIGFNGNAYFDGIIDMHFVENAVLKYSALSGIISLITLSVVMSIACTLVTKNFRFIDILGTMSLAKAPFLILAVVSLFVKMPALEQILQNPLILFTSVSFIVMLVTSIPVIIWTIILMYNGLKVSVGIKGIQLNVVFVTTLIVAEAISKTFIFIVLKP